MLLEVFDGKKMHQRISVFNAHSCSIIFLLSLSSYAQAHTVSQHIGAYQDNEGRTRTRVNVDGAANFSRTGTGLTAASYAVGLSRDYFQVDLANDKYAKEVYQSDKRQENTVSVTANQTWNKETDTHFMGSHSSDGKTQVVTGGVGVAQWLSGESWQIGLDFSRTVTDRPLYTPIDYDATVLDLPTSLTSNGSTVTLRNLTSSTTITNASYTRILSSDRPASHTFGFGVRQFIPAFNGAVHFNGARAYNRGRITTETQYGSVDAWQAEIAYLQAFSPMVRGRVAYRYYKEDETQRAYGDEIVLGTDLISTGVVIDIPRDSKTAAPVSLEVSGTRYITNTHVAARIIEVGLSGKF